MNLTCLVRRLFGLRPDPPGPRFIIGRGYQLDVPTPVYDSRRPFRILSYLESRGLLRRGMLRRPRPVSLDRLRQVHDPAYVASLQDPAAMEAILGFRLDAAAQDAFLAFQRLVCGGTLLAARSAVARGEVAVNLGGGLHHAARDRGSGFCVFNDVAVAVRNLREAGHDFPVLVIDLDLHDGDGTRALFAGDATVHTLSIHNETLGDAGGPTDTVVALGGGVDDRTYLDAVTEHVPRAVAACRPGLVFYLAGSDPGVDDRLGDWRITMEGMLARDRFVMDLLRPRRGPAVPTVVLLAGGYGPTAWRHGAAFFSWLLSGDSRLDIPLEMELPVDHYRRLARLMRHPGLLPGESGDDAGAGGAGADDDWGLSEADLGGAAAPGPAAAGRGLFLGLYSRHGLELLLEESGLLANLKAAGHRKLGLEVDLDDPLGHTVRIVSGRREPVALLEVKLRVGPAAHDPHRTYLVVEWLLLQDPRPGADAPARDLLPGQERGGTGLLRDMAAVLVVAAERLGAAGVVFTPSHYHLARLARGIARFPVAADEARYLACERALRELRLAEAAAAMDAGMVVDAKTGESVGWEPKPMVIPVEPALQDELHGEGFRAEVTRAGSGLDYRRAGGPDAGGISPGPTS
ncbi:histone deacetylase [bacterium]|nr:histone deacetylase [bacterium]